MNNEYASNFDTFGIDISQLLENYDPIGEARFFERFERAPLTTNTSSQMPHSFSRNATGQQSTAISGHIDDGIFSGPTLSGFVDIHPVLGPTVGSTNGIITYGPTNHNIAVYHDNLMVIRPQPASVDSDCSTQAYGGLSSEQIRYHRDIAPLPTRAVKGLTRTLTNEIQNPIQGHNDVLPQYFQGVLKGPSSCTLTAAPYTVSTYNVASNAHCSADGNLARTHLSAETTQITTTWAPVSHHSSEDFPASATKMLSGIMAIPAFHPLPCMSAMSASGLAASFRPPIFNPDMAQIKSVFAIEVNQRHWVPEGGLQKNTPMESVLRVMACQNTQLPMRHETWSTEPLFVCATLQALQTSLHNLDTKTKVTLKVMFADQMRAFVSVCYQLKIALANQTRQYTARSFAEAVTFELPSELVMGAPYSKYPIIAIVPHGRMLRDYDEQKLQKDRIKVKEELKKVNRWLNTSQGAAFLQAKDLAFKTIIWRPPNYPATESKLAFTFAKTMADWQIFPPESDSSWKPPAVPPLFLNFHPKKCDAFRQNRCDQHDVFHMGLGCVVHAAQPSATFASQLELQKGKRKAGSRSEGNRRKRKIQAQRAPEPNHRGAIRFISYHFPSI